MIQNSGRRFLTPAVVTRCDGAAPTALLHAIATLAGEIYGHHNSPASSSFLIHRRIIREVIREAGILLELFEELLNRRSTDHLPGPAAAAAGISLAEIHVALQRIRQLVEDCSRRGARLWLLMRSGQVSLEFQVAVRSIATALDVFPLDAIGVAAEVREVAELVREQGRRVRIAADPADERVAGEVLAAQSRFERGISPDKIDLDRILTHLQIRSWSDCDHEISFLEEEIAAAGDASSGADGVDSEILLLTGLRGLMMYSRSVMFDFSDGSRSKPLDCSDKREAEAIRHLNVEDLKCPISLEIMTDPVTISTGQTYERASIVRWLKAGNLTCPVTGQLLANTDLLPNTSLRNLISQFCRVHNISLAAPARRSHRSGKNLLLGSPAAAEATRLLADFLVGKLSNGTEADRSRAAYEIRLLAKSSMLERACLVQSGVLPWLLNLLYSSSFSDNSTLENATAAVLNLSKHPKGREAIFNSGGINPILNVLRNSPKIESRQNAAATLFYLSSVEDYRRAIGETNEAIPSLVALLKEGNARGKKNAMVALLGLLLSPGNHRRVLAAAGAIPTLIGLVSSEREDLVTDAMAVLAVLAERPEGANAILQYSSAVNSLVDVLCSPAAATEAGKEHCIAVLLHLCNNGGEKVLKLLDRVPSLVPSLYLVLTEGYSSRAGKKAISLIRILQRSRDPNAAGGVLIQQELVVRVQ